MNLDPMWMTYAEGVVVGASIFGMIGYFLGRYHEARRIVWTLDVEHVDGHLVINHIRSKKDGIRDREYEGVQK